jgi:hypothetical protein
MIASTQEQRERLRRLSKIVLGNMDRLEVGVAIARSPDGLVNATDLQEEIGLAQSRIRNQLVALADGELLSAFPSANGKRWYKRVDSPFWQLCLALCDDWMK